MPWPPPTYGSPVAVGALSAKVEATEKLAGPPGGRSWEDRSCSSCWEITCWEKICVGALGRNRGAPQPRRRQVPVPPSNFDPLLKFTVQSEEYNQGGLFGDADEDEFGMPIYCHAEQVAEEICTAAEL